MHEFQEGNRADPGRVVAFAKNRKDSGHVTAEESDRRQGAWPGQEGGGPIMEAGTLGQKGSTCQENRKPPNLCMEKGMMEVSSPQW